MLPGPLVSIYQQYKQDTDCVASWLASTAKSCGYSVDAAAPSPADASKKKRSGRGKRKKQGNAVTGKSVVAIKDFVPMAKVIASQKPAIPVSQFFIKTLHRVIELRSSFGVRLTTHGAAPDDKSDQTHSHFVQVLQQVHEILQPRCSLPDVMPRGPAPATQTLANLFDRLELYGPSQKFLSAPEIAKPEPAISQGHIYEAETPSSRGDAMMAFALLLPDLHTIRGTIVSIWLDHIDDVLDLAACAVTTNTAIDLARNLIAQVEAELEPHGGICAVCRMIFEDDAFAEGCTEDDLADWSTCTKFNLYEIGYISYYDVLTIVESFVAEISPNYEAIVRSGYGGMIEDLLGVPWQEACREKFEHDKAKMAAL